MCVNDLFQFCTVAVHTVGTLSNNHGDGYENFTKTSRREFALLQTLSRLFQLVQFVKCWQIFLELNSKRLYQSSGKEEESRCFVFMSSTKHEIGHFHVVVVHKKGDARAKLLFC